jgi:hypothetical protein
MTRIWVLVVLFLFVLGAAMRLPQKASAAADLAAQTPQEGKGCSVPKEWGRLADVSDRAIAFEDSGGNIRVLDVGPCMRGEVQLIVRIKRQ